MKRHIWKRLLALVLVPLVLAGCGRDDPDGGNDGDSSSASSVQVKLPKTFALPYYADETLDPIICADGAQQAVGALLYEGLFQLDEQLSPQPCLCASYQYDAATFTWTFTLRSGVTFSDGSALTAADVVATLNRARSSARYQSRLNEIDAVSAAGESTVVVKLTRANTGLPALLDIPIVKAGTESQRVPIGTGPYAYTADSAELSARDDWWQGGGQPVSKISLVAVSDEDALFYRFSCLDIQLMVTDLTGSNPVSPTGSVSFDDADTTVLQYVGVNTHREALSSPEIRRAISMSIDRENAVSAFLSGHGRAAQFPISPVSPDYPVSLEAEYSYTDAAEAVSAASVGSRKLTMLVNEENAFKVSMANYIVSLLSALGLNIELKVLPWDSYLSALEAGNFDLYYGEVRLGADWDLRSLVGTGGSLNYGGWSDATTDQLLEDYAAASDRAAAMEKICERLQEQAPIIPVCFKSVTVLSQAGVIEDLQPTASNPFYNLTECTIHLAE